MTELKLAYQYCQRIAKQHYENFPVASLVLPRRLRRPITVIYAFARSADDLADEGDLTEQQRLQALQLYEADLERIRRGEPVSNPIFIALQDVIHRHKLSLTPFFDLLTAFKQDVSKKRYQDIGEVMDYCRRSANPIGRLLLQLFGQDTPRNISLSDGVCSALQLINFLQDIHQDYAENGRIYIPVDEMQRFRVTEMHIRAKLNDASMNQLVQHQVERARKMLKAGAPLGKLLPGRLGFELRLIIYGGTRILFRLHEQKHDNFTRPRLRLVDKAWVIWRSILPK